MTQRRTLLVVSAHPDDESFATGGTLARYAAEGAKVGLVCATRGEMGEIAESSLAAPDTLGDVREVELRNAAKALGVADLVLLGYRDSGMAGTTDNDDPRAFIHVPAEEVVSRLVGVMRRLRPEVVVTFDPGGGYGHPDHVAIHNHAVAAFHAAGNSNRHPHQGPSWQPTRLFYTVFSRSMFDELRARLESLDVDTSQFARFEEAAVLWPDEEVHVALDVSSTIEAKWSAVNSHRTQLGTDHFFRRIPEEMAKEILRHENFRLAWPESSAGVRLSHLFDGL